MHPHTIPVSDDDGGSKGKRRFKFSFIFKRMKGTHNEIKNCDTHESSGGTLEDFDESSMMESLVEPSLAHGVMTERSINGFGDQSLRTMDFDGTSSIMSSADDMTLNTRGTFGNGTSNYVSESDRSVLTDDASFEVWEQNNGMPIREEVYEVTAPPGKLGLSIDTPPNCGAPIVHAVKDMSCLSGKVNPGDHLIAVDDEDVRYCTAIQVSKMLSRRSGEYRTLTFIRTTILDDYKLDDDL